MGYKGKTSGRFIDNLPRTIEAIQADANALKSNIDNLEDELAECHMKATGNVLAGVDYNALNAGGRVPANISAGDPDSLLSKPTQTTILWAGGATSSIVCSSQRNQQTTGWSMVCAIPFDNGKDVTMLRVQLIYTSADNTVRMQKA